MEPGRQNIFNFRIHFYLRILDDSSLLCCSLCSDEYVQIGPVRLILGKIVLFSLELWTDVSLRDFGVLGIYPDQFLRAERMGKVPSILFFSWKWFITSKWWIHHFGFITLKWWIFRDLKWWIHHLTKWWIEVMNFSAFGGSIILIKYFKLFNLIKLNIYKYLKFCLS